MEESLQRGQAFEELIRSKGWELVKGWYQNKIQHFATSLLIGDQKGIVEFENERRELIGLRKLFGLIDNDLKVLREENEKAKRPTKE